MLTHFAVYGSTSDKNARTVHFSGPSRGDLRRKRCDQFSQAMACNYFRKNRKFRIALAVADLLKVIHP